LAAVGRRITHRGTYTVTVGHSHLQDDDRSEAVGYLEQAQEVYRRIGTPGLAHVEQTLRDQGLASSAAASPRDHQ